MKKIQVVRNERSRSVSAHIGPARLSYVFLTEPFKAEGTDEGKYMATILIPKEDTEAVEAIRGLIDAAMEQGRVEKWKQRIPAACRTPLRDGDDRQNDPDGIYRGHWYICCTARKPVPVYSRNGLPLLDAQQIYSGMWGAVDVAFAPYATTGNNGVGAYLNGVMKTRDDDRFGGGGSSAASFSCLSLDDDEAVGDDDL